MSTADAGRLGGQKRSQRKTEAARKNIKKRWDDYRARKQQHEKNTIKS